MSKHMFRSVMGMGFFLALLIVGMFFFFDQRNTVLKTAPVNHMAAEEVKQAKALQKLGQLENAFEVFEKYALRGYPEAMFHTAKSYSRGWGVKPDLERARHFLRLAVQYDYSYRGQTAYELGRLFQRSSGPDCNTIAVGWFTKAMEWDFTKASLQLSKHYELGIGVEQDIGKAIYFYEIASRAGYETALLKYAYILLKGRYGIRPDPERAYAMVERAVISLRRKAESGSRTSAKKLGRLYQKGQLVPVNLSVARQWFLRTAMLGDRGGMHDLGHVMLAGDGSPEDHVEGLAWLEKAAELGHGGAMTALGRFHIKEKYGLTKSNAVYWFEKGVEAGHGGAMQELAKIYDKGTLVEKDPEKAIRFAQMGSDVNHSGSKRLLKKLLKKTETKS
ncbi:MAG: sel1 repeat family protein [Emcibacter sp.]|nr:sel1 repeat family protein [Emcibacter sp.]